MSPSCNRCRGILAMHAPTIDSVFLECEIMFVLFIVCPLTRVDSMRESIGDELAQLSDFSCSTRTGSCSAPGRKCESCLPPSSRLTARCRTNRLAHQHFQFVQNDNRTSFTRPKPTSRVIVKSVSSGTRWPIARYLFVVLWRVSFFLKKLLQMCILMEFLTVFLRRLLAC